MTVWAEGSDSYSDETRYRVITPTEFARRARYTIARQEISITWLLGAGCSVSSGVPSADDAVRSWIAELKHLETGEPGDVDAWAARRFVGYDPERPGRVYGEVLQALFFTEQERWRALEKLMAAAEAGFGYATLAQLMTHEKWGQRCNFAITTNVDGLAEQALQMFSQHLPQFFTCDTIGPLTPIRPTSPALVKIFGDAHLPQRPEGANRPEFNPQAKERLRERLSETAVVMVGYGGRDHCVANLLEGLPADAPAGVVYWVNAEPPEGAIGDWLEERGGVWVQHSDFDELMFLLRLEFGLGHPKIERFERVLKKYGAQYKELSTRTGFGLESSTDEEAETLALQGSASIGGRRTPERKKARFKQSLLKVHEVMRGASLMGGASIDAPAPAGAGQDAPSPVEASPGLSKAAAIADELIDAASRELHTTMESMGAPKERSNYASNPPVEQLSIDDGSVADDLSGRVAPEPPRKPLRDPGALIGGSRGLTARSPEVIARAIAMMSGEDDRSEDAAMGGRGDADLDEVAGALAAPIEPERKPLPAEPSGALSPEDAAEGVAAFAEALDGSPNDAVLRCRFARYLAVAAQDLSRAEEEFELAMQLAPKNAAILRDYATFALDHLHEPQRAERLLTRALNLDIRNPKTLICLANFLLRARGDLEQADDCLRLAVEVQPDHPLALIAYARFLEERRGRREEAETYLKRAAESRPKNADALAEYALFRAFKAQNLGAAETLLNEAARLDPRSATVLFAQAAMSELKGDLDLAERRYRAAVAANARDMRAQLAYARFLRVRREDPAACEAQLRRANEAAPRASEPVSALAEYFDDVRNDPVAAEQRHREAIELDPYNPYVLAAFAAHMGRRKDMVDEADALFLDAISLAPRSAEIFRMYGRFRHQACGDLDGAEKNLRLAVDVEPHGVEALDELAKFLHLVRGDHEEAEIYYREALRLAPDQSGTMTRFAQFLRDSRGDMEEAERIFRAALERNPRNAAALAKHAQFLLAQGHRAEGIKILNDAFDAAYAMDMTARPDWLMLELWFHRYAHDPSRREEALRNALGLIEAGARSEGADLRPTVESAIAAGHPDPQLLRDLARVAAEGGDPSILPSNY